MNEVLPNDYCMDCYTNHVEFASINNGIFLCSNCAKLHNTLGRDISYIVETVESIEPYYGLYFQRGGNTRFLNFCKKYNINNMDPRAKYRTKACEYFRKLLKSEIEGEFPPKSISFEEAQQLLYNDEIEKTNINA